MNLTDEKKQRLAEVFARYPAYRDELMQRLKDRGALFDVDEYLPVDWGVERAEATKGALESLTLGLYDPGERDPRAGDIDILGMNLSPSRTAGAIVGAAPSVAIGGAGGAGLAARMGAGAAGRTVGRVAGGEAAPGFIEGLIRSEGDPEEAVKNAALWTATGLMLEGTGRLAMKAIRKAKQGKTLTDDERLAVVEYNRIAEGEGLPKLGPAPAADEIGRWGLTPRDLGISPHTVGYEQATEEARSALISLTHRVDEMVGARMESVSLRRESLDDASTSLAGDIDELMADLPHISPDRQMALKEQMSSVWRALLVAVDEGKIDHKSANILFRQVGQGTVDADELLELIPKAPDLTDRYMNVRWQSLQKDVGEDIEEAWEEFEVKLSRKQKRKAGQKRGRGRGPYIARGRRASRGRGGGVDLPDQPATGVEARPATDEQVTRIHELTQALRKEGDDFAIPSPDEVRQYNLRDARKIEVQARRRLSFTRSLRRNQALHRLQQEAADPEGVKRAWLDRDTPPSDMPEADKAAWRELKRKQKLGRLVYDDAETLKAPGLPYYLGVVPNVSRWGLGANPVTKAVVEKAFGMFEDLGRQKDLLWKRYRAAIEPLEASRAQKLQAAVGSREAREALEEEARLKGLLVQALDGRGTNEILQEHGQLVPIYNELRTMFDELADGLGLARNERISDYFPHLYADDTALWRVNRMANDLGGRARFAAKYLPEDLAKEIPEGRFFGSLIERRGQDAAFSEDLDAVMYAYMHGALETPRFGTFLRDANEALDRLPVDNEQMRKAFADWTNYVVGRPSDWKKTQARWWAQNETFNKWVDNAVEWLGDAETKGLLERSRRGQLSPEEEQLAMGFFDKLLTDANRFTKEGKIKGRDVKQYRAHLALLIDNMRAALASPTARPVVMEKLYQLMVINKLGFSFSHMLTNFTQTMTNTMPKVGVKYVTRGMRRYSGNRQNEYKNGRTVEEVLEESGVLADIPEHREFFGSQTTGFLNGLDNVALAPAKFSEEFNRGVAFLSRYEQAIDEGMEHAAALVDARKMTRETQFVFNRAGTMPLFRNPGMRFLLMFQSYGMHQINFSAELMADAMKGNREAQAALFKHVLAYITLGSAAAAANGVAPNLGQQTEHPLLGMMSAEKPLDVLGGPPADMLLEMLQGNVSQALSELTEPAIERRIERAVESGEITQLLGLKSQ